MANDFDVIVVGGRCAGAPLAANLARAGVRVCVVDKDQFPSDTLSTHAIQPIGVKALERLGVRDELERIAPPIRRGRLIFDDGIAHVPDIAAVTGAPVLSVRRFALDEILIEAAREAGAEVRAETRVDDLIIEVVYAEGIRAWPELHESVASAQREGGVNTMANMHGYFRESAGPGWALVGDAGHFKDPSPGQGIADALRQSERLTTDIVRALGAGSELEADRILADWWRWRDEDAWEMYWFARDMGADGPTPPFLRALQREIAADPALTEATSRVFNHELRPSEAFPPALVLKTAGRALRERRGERSAIAREVATAIGDVARRRRALRKLPSAA